MKNYKISLRIVANSRNEIVRFPKGIFFYIRIPFTNILNTYKALRIGFYA